MFSAAFFYIQKQIFEQKCLQSLFNWCKTLNGREGTAARPEGGGPGGRFLSGQPPGNLKLHKMIIPSWEKIKSLPPFFLFLESNSLTRSREFQTAKNLASHSKDQAVKKHHSKKNSPPESTGQMGAKAQKIKTGSHNLEYGDRNRHTQDFSGTP